MKLLPLIGLPVLHWRYRAHNCIAHQDYTANARIVVVEKVDRLLFENSGSFFDGKPEDYFSGERTPQRYRNPWLAQAMVNLDMIDTVGHGIHAMLLAQRRRFFPLPDYSKSLSNQVILEIYGHLIDENYTKLLLENQNLSIITVIGLDRVQKKTIDYRCRSHCFKASRSD